MNDNEASNKLIEARKMIESLDSRYVSFIQRGCDKDILQSFHLDIFIFGLFALQEFSLSQGGVGEDELQLLDSLVDENFGLKVYKQTMNMTDIWAGYEGEIPYSLSVLTEYSSQDELEKNCNDYINLHGDLHYCLCTHLGFDDLRVTKKIMKMSLYCMSRGA